MNERIIVYNSLNTWWSYQLSLEVYFRSLEISDEVFWINLATQNSKKFEMNSSDYIRKIIYKKPDKQVSKLKSQFSLNMYTDYLKVPNKKKYLVFKDVNDLRSYEIEGFNIGAQVYSFICGKFQSTNIDFQKSSSLTNYYINHALEVYRTVQSNIKDIDPTLILIANDRLLPSAAAISVARKNKIKTNIFYWGSSTNKIVFYSTSLYSFDEWNSKIYEDWHNKNLTKQDMNELKLKFIDRFGVKHQAEQKFQSYVIPGSKLNISEDKKLAVLYAGSEWEHSPIFSNQNKNETFIDQYSAFYEIAKLLINKGWIVVLKLHPLNQGSLNQKFQAEWEKLKKIPQIVILEKSTRIDTYELMKQAQLNIVWESTVGLECVARRLPLLVAGDPFWVSRDSNFRVKNVNQLQSFLDSDTYIPKIEEVLPWFNYIRNFGDNFRYVRTNNYRPSYANLYIIEERILFKLIKKIINLLKM